MGARKLPWRLERSVGSETGCNQRGVGFPSRHCHVAARAAHADRSEGEVCMCLGWEKGGALNRGLFIGGSEVLRTDRVECVFPALF